MIKKLILGEFIKENIGKYVIGILALLSAALLELSMPKLLGYITDCLAQRSVSMERIYQLVVLMLGLGIVLFLLKFVFRMFLIGKSRDLECFLREKLFAHLQTLPSKFYNNKKTGDLMAYAINDLGAIRMAFAFGLVFLIEGVLINLASLIVMIKTIDGRLTLLTIGPIFICFVIITKMRKIIRQRFTVVQEAFAQLSDKIQENISGIRVVKAYAQEKEEIKKLEGSSNHRKEVQMNYVKMSGFLMPAGQICFGISFTLVLVVGSSLVRRGAISLGDFIAFNTYLAMLIRPVLHLGRIVEVWQRALASMKRLDNVFMETTDIVDEEPKYKEEKFQGRLQIRNLTFQYPENEKEVLKKINIDLEPGKTLAIIGKTGCGKTTLVNLLLRLYKVERGQIFIDGMDINDIPLATLRTNIGYVPQDNFLFSTTIKENIGFFNPIYKDDSIEEAAKMSNVYENIIDFPNGFDTLIGERGITLSGGQKQRISIARAIVKDPSILIMDDSLSAVDTKTEEEILKNIKTVLEGRTGIMIAHRISTIKHADLIVVLDNGKIIEQGNHESLLKQKGQYYQLYHSQMAENSFENEKEMAI